MISNIRKLITQSYESISPDNLFIIKSSNILNSRDDIIELYERRRFFISELRVHLSGMSELIEEIEYCNGQLQRILDKEQNK